jgi:hypothetical protein
METRADEYGYGDSVSRREYTGARPRIGDALVPVDEVGKRRSAGRALCTKRLAEGARARTHGRAIRRLRKLVSIPVNRA